MDITPTILDITGVKHPGDSYDGRDVLPLRGKSLLPAIIAADVPADDETIFGGELFHGRFLRKGDWKAVWDIAPKFDGKGGPWQLYNLAEDPGELRDLASKHPDVLAELIAAWEEYANETGVILPSYD